MLSNAHLLSIDSHREVTYATRCSRDNLESLPGDKGTVLYETVPGMNSKSPACLVGTEVVSQLQAQEACSRTRPSWSHDKTGELGGVKLGQLLQEVERDRPAKFCVLALADALQPYFDFDILTRCSRSKSKKAFGWRHWWSDVCVSVFHAML